MDINSAQVILGEDNSIAWLGTEIILTPIQLVAMGVISAPDTWLIRTACSHESATLAEFPATPKLRVLLKIPSFSEKHSDIWGILDWAYDLLFNWM